MAKYIEAIPNKLYGLLYNDGRINYVKKWNESLSGRIKCACHINDAVSDFPYTDQDYIILKARELYNPLNV